MLTDRWEIDPLPVPESRPVLVLNLPRCEDTAEGHLAEGHPAEMYFYELHGHPCFGFRCRRCGVKLPPPWGEGTA